MIVTKEIETFCPVFIMVLETKPMKPPPSVKVRAFITVCMNSMFCHPLFLLFK